MFMSQFTSNIKKAAYGSISIILFFIFWQVSVSFVPDGIISPPTQVFKSLYTSATSDVLIQHTWISLERVGLGFALSLAVGIPLGFLLGTFFKSVEKILLPFLRLCEKLNPFAIIPIFMIFFGVDTLEKVVVIFWASIWPVLFNTLAGAKNVDSQLVRAARSMGSTKKELFLKVILPYSLPNIFIGLEIAAQISFFMIIASEVIGASTGLGWYYHNSAMHYDLPLMYAVVLYITLLSIIINYFFGRLKKHFLVWKEASL